MFKQELLVAVPALLVVVNPALEGADLAEDEAAAGNQYPPPPLRVLGLTLRTHPPAITSVTRWVSSWSESNILDYIGQWGREKKISQNIR